MVIKDIFVPILGLPGDEGALESAIRLAGEHGARISALAIVDIPMPFFSEVGFVANDVSAVSYNQAREQAEARAERARERLSATSLGWELSLADATQANRGRALAAQARYSDLTVMAGPDGAANAEFEALLMQSGRPVIVVPPGASLPARPEHVVVAWQPTREATRAVHDALPLLEPDTQVDLLVLDPEKLLEQEGDHPGSRIAERLGRLGLSVRVVAQSGNGRTEGESLVRYLDESNADLLVMGGYGHSRLRELILGGTTRTVLENAGKPVFFEH